MHIGDGRAAIVRITRPERAIAILVAIGASNAEIARRLVIPDEEVADHAAAALCGLAQRGRTQIVAWAGDHWPYGLDRVGDTTDRPEPAMLRSLREGTIVAGAGPTAP